MLKTLNQSIKVLNLFAQNTKQFSAKEITSLLDMPHINVYRILETFVNNRYLIKDEETKQYSIGPALAPLIYASEHKYNVVTLVQPLLYQLMDTVKEAVYLVSLESNNTAKNIDAYIPRDKATFAVSLNDAHPLYAGASYWTLMAYLSEKEIATELARPFDQLLYPEKITPDFLRIELGKIKQNGYAISYEATTPELVAIAAPIFKHQQIIGSVTIAIPTFRSNPATISELATELKKTAKAITDILSLHQLDLQSYHLFNQRHVV